MTVVVYILAIILANLSAAFFGAWVTPINAFLFIGMDLSLRDKLHIQWHNNGIWWKMGMLIFVAGVISYCLNPASKQIAIASVISFIASAVADTGVYSLLFKRTFMYRSTYSNIFGAAVDSVLFPTLAFGVLMPGIILGQFAAKVIGGVIWSCVIYRTYYRNPPLVGGECGSMKTHELKTWPEAFWAVQRGDKTHEFRKNDRDYQESDILVLREWNQYKGKYSGFSVRAEVTYINHGPDFGMPEGYCVMSIRLL